MNVKKFFLLLIMLGILSFPAVFNGAQTMTITKSLNMKSNNSTVLDLVIIWHQHQPSYQDPETKIYEQPWAFMHGINSYPYMADVLNDFPDINVTINLTPSLLKQLKDYIDGVAWDRRIQLAYMDESGMSFENKSIVMQYFFDINSQFRQEGSRYYELSEKRNQYRSLSEQVNAFTDQDFLDLKVLFFAHWINPRYTTLAKSPVANITLENDVAGHHYSKAEKTNLLNYCYQLVQDAINYHDLLQNSGRLEIMTTPFYHPILPLLIDLNAGKEANPDEVIPTDVNTQWPEDVLAQIQKGRNFTESIFGEYPVGMWPSEQAVSDDIIPYVVDSGIEWIVTDYTILRKSLGVSDLTPEQWFKPYKVTKDGKSVAVFFRHQDISDRVGFTYGGLHPNAAAQDMVDFLKDIRDNWNGTGNPVFTVALDGENAWEHYQYDLDGDGTTEYTGNLFREKLYEKLEQAQTDGWLRSITPHQYLQEHPLNTLEELPTLATGSWSGGYLSTWIGEDAENLAWRRLIRTRDDLVQYQTSHPDANLTDAWEALYAAEGSDWFWWYGADQESGHDELFDWAFKTNLRGVYKGMNWTDQDILTNYPELFLQLLPSIPADFKGKNTPTIDGIVSTGEWDLAAVYYDNQTGEATDFIHSTYVGVDEALDALYFRIDTTSTYPLASTSNHSIGIYFSNPQANNSAIYPRFADTTNVSHILGFELFTELRIDLDDTSAATMYQVNSTNEWELTSVTVSTLAVNNVIEIKVPLSVLDIKKGDTIYVAFIATDDSQGKNIDTAPQDGPWRISVPSGGINFDVEIFSMTDPAFDERGIYPTNPEMHPNYNTSETGVMDILRFRVGTAFDENSVERVYFEFKFRALFNPWNAPAGYSHPLMQVYVDKDNIAGSGATYCDQNGHFNVSSDYAWEIMVRADGWLQYYKLSNGTQGSGITTGSDALDKIIYYSIPISTIGRPTQNWTYTVVVGSQDFQAFREFYSEVQEWKFGGGDDSAYDPNLVDILVPEGMNETEVLNDYSVAEERYVVIPAVGPSITYTPDTEAPVIAITTPSTDPYNVSLTGNITTAKVTIEWTVTDNVGVVKQEVYDGNVFITELNGSTTSYGLDLSEGKHIIRINAYDARDNIGSASITINVSSPTTAVTPGFLTFPVIVAILLLTLKLLHKPPRAWFQEHSHKNP
ncbi:MAG: glucodextranase DOMON-like domain-containing protein [Candidatus Hodarchaeota archaeon]